MYGSTSPNNISISLQLGLGLAPGKVSSGFSPHPLNAKGTMKCGPREDATRICSAGVLRRRAMDISPLRRVNQAGYLLTSGARECAFRNKKTIVVYLANELINATKGSSSSYGIKKKDEIERVAKANH
ncbi:putative ribosomal protein S5/S7 [Dioscorea sansibarensis]